MHDQYDLALLIFGIIALGWAVFSTCTGEAWSRSGEVRRDKPRSSFGDESYVCEDPSRLVREKTRAHLSQSWRFHHQRRFILGK